MKIGIPKEIKNEEYRVAITPDRVARLAAAGHELVVEFGAGQGSGFGDAEFVQAGAALGEAPAAWDADLVLKVKEPLESEYAYLREQMVFTFFHLAGAPKSLTETLLERGTTAIAYETLEDSQGRLPILAPMSAIAGNMATLVGAYYLARFNGGKGVQLGAVLGESHGKVVIIGDGVVGRHAARSALGLGADVFIAGLDAGQNERLRQEVGEARFFVSEPSAIARHLREADLVVGAVLKHGARADYVVTEAMVQTMQAGSVIVDVSIDQGGCVETSRPTSHSDPVYTRHGVIHYCVTNMPGAYPRTATLALAAATFPYVAKLAGEGLGALRGHTGLARAVNTHHGVLTCQPAALALGLGDQYRDFAAL